MSARSPLYQLEAFGLNSAWLVWKIANGGLDEVCSRCKGRGRLIGSPCRFREIAVGEFEPRCDLKTGCGWCRRKCPDCKGVRLPAAAVHAEDFGDEESRAIAAATFPGMEVDARPRSDREAGALG